MPKNSTLLVSIFRLSTVAALLLASLFLTAAVNKAAGAVLDAWMPQTAWVATAAIPSCTVIACLFLLLAPLDLLRWPTLNPEQWRGAAAMAAAWLAFWLIGCMIAASVAGHWITYAVGFAPVMAFLVFGPLGEELLFRGIIFEQINRLSPRQPKAAIYLSTLAFSLHHLAIATAPHGLAIVQLLFTIPMGIVFARLRLQTGSIWPGFLLHVATNLVGVL